MNPMWKLSLLNIESEAVQLKDALSYFANWRISALNYKKDDVTIQNKQRQRFFLSNKTYKNMKFSICGFMSYAKQKLENREITYVPSGHSNTSALESRFSLAKRAQLNSSEKYHHAAANQNTTAILKHSATHGKRKGNTSYPGSLIVAEREEAVDHDQKVGQMMNERIKRFQKIEVKNTEQLGNHFILSASIIQPKSILCSTLKTQFETTYVPQGNFVLFLRNHPVIQELLLLCLS